MARIGDEVDQNITAYQAGLSQHTFHRLDDDMVEPLLELCCRLNPAQRKRIEKMCGRKITINEVNERDSTAIAGKIITEPVRREILLETYDRRSAWSRKARKLFGHRCMIPECKFALMKNDGELFIQVHHIQWMCEHGSPNDPKSLSVLCPNHHAMIHHGAPELRSRLEGQIRREQARRMRIASKNG